MLLASVSTDAGVGSPFSTDRQKTVVVHVHNFVPPATAAFQPMEMKRSRLHENGDAVARRLCIVRRIEWNRLGACVKVAGMGEELGSRRGRKKRRETRQRSP
jgi:hypothetical protein